MDIRAKKVASNIAETRRIIEQIVGDGPGLEGIKGAKALTSLNAVLDDVTRGVASALTDGDDDTFREFLVAANASFMRS